MKFIITTCLAVVLCLVLVTHTLKRRQHPLEHAGRNATDMSLTPDLRQVIQASLANGAARPRPEIDATIHSQFPLPRDPFAFRAAATPQGQPSPLAETEPPPPLPEALLRLKATAIDRHGALAFINDQVLSVGQAILGYTVVHIDAGQVELTGNGVTISLYLEETVNP
jgi:hypothetical protein